MLCRPSLLCCVLLVSLAGPPARAQAPSSAPSNPADYSKEAAVAELVAVKANFENDGTSTQELTLRVRVQSDAGVKTYGLQTFSYQAATQTIEVEYLRVRKPDGSVVVTPPDNIQDLDAGITRDAPFYSDLREKHAAVKGLSPGDELEYQVRWHTTKPLAPSQFWYSYDFDHDAIVLDEGLEISVPRDRPVKLKSPGYTWAVTETKDRRTYTWKTSNLKNHSQDDRAIKEHNAQLGLLPSPDVQLSSFQSWDEVGRWYWGLQQERSQPTAEIRAKYSELTKGSTDTSAIVHSLYDFVSTKFRYIGVAFGIGRYQPHAAEDVLSNQFGDCKDKYTLLASLLEAGGIKAYPALINSSRRLDPDVPSPSQFDHVITVVPQGDKFQWLDTTTEVGPFGYLVPPLRDKTALVIPGDKPATLVSTPAELPFPGVQKLTVDAKLGDDGTLNAKMNYTARGDFEVLLRTGFRQVPQAQWKDLVQQISYGMGFAGTVSDVTASSPEDTGSQFQFSYSYNRKDYPDWNSQRITMPGLQLSVPLVKDDDSDSKTPIWLGTPVLLVSDTKVELPAGYSPELPDDVVLIRDYAEYHSTYRQEGNTIVSHRELRSKLGQVPDGSREDYKKFAKSLGEDVSRFVVLTASSSAAPMVRDPAGASLAVAFRTLPDSSNKDAQKFEKDAVDQMGPDPPGAVDSMKKALAADPKFVRGWIKLGALYMALSEPNSALSAFHSAIDSDPTQPVSYEILAGTLTSLHRVDEAIQTWQALLKVAPDDPTAMRSLGELFYVDGRYADAVPILEKEVKLDPNSLALMSRLGTAYLKSGDADKGYATFQQVLKVNSGPESLNDIAYELADSNTKLPDALDYAEKAVRTEEESTANIHLSSLKDEDLGSTRSIASFWDTLGWVHFRLGHLDVAEKYLRASWQLSEKAIVADHLGQLYEQKQRRADAIHMYRLALRASTSFGNGEDKDQINAHLAHLLGTDLSTGFDLHRGDPTGEELSQMRNVKLRRFFQGSASADYSLLFGPEAKLEEVKFIKGSDKLEGAEKFIRAATLPMSYPDGSKARVVRRGIVSCSSFTGCSLVLLTPDMVTSVN